MNMPRPSHEVIKLRRAAHDLVILACMTGGASLVGLVLSDCAENFKAAVLAVRMGSPSLALAAVLAPPMSGPAAEAAGAGAIALIFVTMILLFMAWRNHEKAEALWTQEFIDAGNARAATGWGTKIHYVKGDNQDYQPTMQELIEWSESEAKARKDDTWFSK